MRCRSCGFCSRPAGFPQQPEGKFRLGSEESPAGKEGGHGFEQPSNDRTKFNRNLLLQETPQTAKTVSKLISAGGNVYLARRGCRLPRCTLWLRLYGSWKSDPRKKTANTATRIRMSSFSIWFLYGNTASERRKLGGRFGRQTPRRWGWGIPLKKRATARIGASVNNYVSQVNDFS